MMKRLLCLLLTLACLLPAAVVADGQTAWYDEDGVYRTNTYGRVQRAELKMRMATRSGPSTNYDELGSYFKKGQEVSVISRAWDERNGIWWVQVEFNYGGSLRRAYTGLKRVDIDINAVQEDVPLMTAFVSAETIPYYGPGTQYTAHKQTVEYGTVGTVYAFENGWAQFEFYEAEENRYRRVWMPAGCLDWDIYTSHG